MKSYVQGLTGLAPADWRPDVRKATCARQPRARGYARRTWVASSSASSVTRWRTPGV